MEAKTPYDAELATYPRIMQAGSPEESHWIAALSRRQGYLDAIKAYGNVTPDQVRALVAALQEADAMIAFLISALPKDATLYDNTGAIPRIKAALAPFQTQEVS